MAVPSPASRSPLTASGTRACRARSPTGQGCAPVGQASAGRGRHSGQDFGQEWLVIVADVTTPEVELNGTACAAVDAKIVADTGASRSVDSGRLSDEQLRAWVARSCAEQGVPLHVTDVLVLERVRVLLTGTAAPGTPPALRPGPPRSESPDRLHPVRVQGAGAQDAGADDGVVQDGPDDGGLPGEVQLIPRSA